MPSRSPTLSTGWLPRRTGLRPFAAARAAGPWVIRRIEVVELPDGPAGDELTLTSRDGERELLVDGASTFGSIPALEELGAARGESYVVQGHRLVERSGRSRSCRCSGQPRGVA